MQVDALKDQNKRDIKEVRVEIKEGLEEERRVH